MKFTSIVFAALVAATQFSSTFAQTFPKETNIAVADTATTYFGTAVVIPVADNDGVTNARRTPKNIPIARAFRKDNIVEYTITLGTGNDGPKNGVAVVVPGSAGTAASIKYTPNANFAGSDLFTYTFVIRRGGSGNRGSESTPSDKVGVTVTVSPKAIPQSFEIPGLVSNEDAKTFTRGGLLNFAALTPGTPGTPALTNTLQPVIGGGDSFLANVRNFLNLRGFIFFGGNN